MDSFGKRLSLRMREKKITNRELAEAIGVHASAVSLYVKDKGMPRMDVFMRIIELLGCSCDYLLRGVESVDQQPDKSVEYLVKLNQVNERLIDKLEEELTAYKTKSKQRGLHDGGENHAAAQ